MKRAALYLRVSTVDQHPETQLHDLREFARQRGLRSCGSTPTTALAARKHAVPHWTNSWKMLADTNSTY